MKRFLSILLLAVLLLTGCCQENTEETKATDPSGSVAPPVSEDAVKMYLNKLTLEEKVGQLFIVKPEQLAENVEAVTEVTATIQKALELYPVGGIVLFAENVVLPEQLLALNQGLQEASDIPLFLAVDEEGGQVVRLARNEAFSLPKYKHAASVGASGDPEDALQMGSTIGAYMKEYELNLNFAPVADVNTNPSNPIIGTRAFSSDPLIAAKMAEAFAQGSREMGVVATFKHFPGHGDTAQDSHVGLAVSYKSKEELRNCEWIPFRSATSMDMVMVGHIALPQVTGTMTPATMSKELVTEILKEDLGFSGLVVTDALNMGAITKTYAPEDAALAALQAGCDLLLMPENFPATFAAVVDALKDGTLSMQWLDDTVYRILKFKCQQGILTIETKIPGNAFQGN